MDTIELRPHVFMLLGSPVPEQQRTGEYVEVASRQIDRKLTASMLPRMKSSNLTRDSCDVEDITDSFCIR
jgi:hypothetical protein